MVNNNTFLNLILLNDKTMFFIQQELQKLISNSK